MQLIVDTLTEFRLSIIILHDVKTRVDRLLILQWEHQPTAQQTASHWTHGPVDDIQERLTVFLHRVHQLQRANGKFVQTHIPVFLNARNTCDMTYLSVLSLFEILQDSSSCNNTRMEMIDAKTLQVLHIEVAQQLLL